jgi:hypothetical protein
MDHPPFRIVGNRLEGGAITGEHDTAGHDFPGLHGALPDLNDIGWLIEENPRFIVLCNTA